MTFVGVRFGASTRIVVTTTLLDSFVSRYRSRGSTTALTRMLTGTLGGAGVHRAVAVTGVPGSTVPIVVFAHADRAQYTSIGLSSAPSPFRSTSSPTNVTLTGEYTGTSVVTEIVVVRFVGTPSPTGEGEAVSPWAARSGRTRETVAPPAPNVTPARTSTSTPWLPASVLAGVLSS